ncbi:MAG: hypothetical protein ACK56F_18645 [bacterium]
MQAQLDIFMLGDVAAINKKHLKILALQPAGKSVIPNYIFPSTKEHFDLLKSLGTDRAFQKL